MILDDQPKLDIQRFKKDFERKFGNFCSKAPIYISFAIDGSQCLVYQHNTSGEHGGSRRKIDLIFSYTFDYSLSVKQNIFLIKGMLEADFYPRFTYYKKESYYPSPAELNRLVEDGKVSLEEAPTYQAVKVIDTIPYLIERVVVQRDEIFILNQKTGEQLHYKMKKPVTIFLKSLSERTIVDPGEYFFKYAELVDNQENSYEY